MDRIGRMGKKRKLTGMEGIKFVPTPCILFIPVKNSYPVHPVHPV
jgi:hypothetical protein